MGDSVGFVRPDEVLARLKLQAGDTVFLVESPKGVLLTPFNPASKEEITARG
nr:MULTISPECIES: AbrB/MazE/SpoVT family DNA-binding domain-containing protein [unclassified Simplicispira]